MSSVTSFRCEAGSDPGLRTASRFFRSRLAVARESSFALRASARLSDSFAVAVVDGFTPRAAPKRSRVRFCLSESETGVPGLIADNEALSRRSACC